MIPLSIGSATEVYGNAARCEIIRKWVDHQLLADVSRSLRGLVQSLGDEATDEYWRQTLGPIRKLAFSFCSVPLPFAQAATSTGIDWCKVHRQVRLSQQMFPDSYESLAQLVHMLERLSAENSSPLVAPLEELLRQCGGLSVTIRNPRMNQAVAEYFSSNPSLRSARVVSAAQLRGAHICDVLAAIGPCGWFPEYVFAAPRAVSIHVISFRWIRDAWKPGPVFLHNSTDCAGGHHRLGTMPQCGDDSGTNDHAISDIQPSDLLPPKPVFLQRPFPSADGQSICTEETTPARLCHLSGNRAVFVAADDGATSLIIDMSEIGRVSINRTPTDELEPGFFLLLRTSGGGDFIAPIADRLLGDLATIHRSRQAEWKESLIAKASERFGSLSRRELSSHVSAELRSQQLSLARAANVYYWMSAKCISPRKVEDFAAIMSFAGLQGRTQELWTAMEEIDRAHKRAGFLIRRMLLEKIEHTSLEILQRDGEMVFDLGDQDGGTLSAFQITGIQEGDYEVPTDRIGVLMDTEE